MQGMNELIITLIHVGHCSSDAVGSEKKGHSPCLMSMTDTDTDTDTESHLQVVVEPCQVDHNSPSAFAANLT